MYTTVLPPLTHPKNLPDELSKSVNSPLKAIIILLVDCKDLCKISRAMLLFLVAMGARSGSAKSIDRDSWLAEFREWTWTTVTWSATRVPIEDENYNDIRIIPSRLVPEVHYFPISHSWLEDFILAPLNKERERRLGYTRINADNTRARYTGHSIRRTYAVFVRVFLHRNGINVTPKKPKIDIGVLTRANQGGGWKDQSHEIWDYSGDWFSHIENPNLVDRDILWWILTGKRKGIDM